MPQHLVLPLTGSAWELEAWACLVHNLGEADDQL